MTQRETHHVNGQRNIFCRGVGTLMEVSLCAFLLCNMRRFCLCLTVLVFLPAVPARAEGDWEITADSALALDRGLAWLANNQGPDGNWSSNDLGLVSLGALAFLADGHAPGRGRYGAVVQRALNYVIENAKPNGLLNISNSQRDMYNHGLATFVLGQAHGTMTQPGASLHRALDRGLRVIRDTQCEDGGWDYRVRRQARGHDLSLVVMQAKALRSASDSGLQVPPEVVQAAIACVFEYYAPKDGTQAASTDAQQESPGQFAYSKGGGGETIAMAAAGVVCLQEFGIYDDWRIAKNMAVIHAAIDELPPARRDGTLPFDAYTLYYASQAIYQRGDKSWADHYGKLRDYLVQSQMLAPGDSTMHGSWRDNGANGGGKVGGRPGALFGTAVACFTLAIPNRYLPILQAGRASEFNQPDSGNRR